MKKAIQDILNQGATTARLRLRKLVPEDARDMFEYTSSETTCKYLTWEPHRRLTQTEQFITNTIEKYREPVDILWGIEEKSDKKLIGVIRIYDISDKQAMISYILNEQYTGRGYMTEAVRIVMDICFDNLDIECVCADYVEENQLSKRVMERCGMHPVDKIPETMIAKGKTVKVYQYMMKKGD